MDTPDGLYVTINGLTENGRRYLATGWPIPVAEARVASIAEEAAVFALVNGGGTPQTEADMARAAEVANG